MEQHPLCSWWSKKPSPEHSWFIGQGSCSCNVLLARARQHGQNFGSSGRNPIRRSYDENTNIEIQQ